MNIKNKTIMVAMQYEGALAADMVARGWEPTLYAVTGPRGGCVMAWKSLKTGEYDKL